MSRGVVQGYVWRSNRRLLILALLALALAALCAPFAVMTVMEASRGPLPLDADALKAAADPNARPTGFVVVTSNQVVSTGFGRFREGSNVPEDQEILIGVGDKVLLANPANHMGGKYLGDLIPHSSYQSETVIPTLEREKPELRGKILPYSMSIRVADEPIATAVALCLPPALAAGAGIVLLLILLYLNIGQARHPFRRSLARFGTPAEVARAIDEDVGGDKTETVGRALLTPSWLIAPVSAKRSGPRLTSTVIQAQALIEGFPILLKLLVGQFSAFRIADLVWIYMLVPTNPVIKDFSLRLFDRHGYSVTILSRDKEELDRIAAWVQKSAPWVLLIYKPEYEFSWFKNRASLVALVDRRRQGSQLSEIPSPPLQCAASLVGGKPTVPFPVASALITREELQGPASWNNMIGGWLHRGSGRLLKIGVAAWTLAGLCGVAAVVFAIAPFAAGPNAAESVTLMTFAGSALAALGAFPLCLGLAWRRQPALHPIARTLNRFGSPAVVAEAVENEAHAGQTDAAGRTLLTPSWLVCPIYAEKGDALPLLLIAHHPVGIFVLLLRLALLAIIGPFSVFRIGDLVWCYKTFPVSGKKGTCFALLFDRHGYNVRIPGPAEEVDRIIAWVGGQAPWVLVGYQKEFDFYWQKNRPALAALVDQRRLDLQVGAVRPQR